MTTLVPVNNATAGDIVTRALKTIQVYARDQTPSADELADGLRILNALLDTFANDPGLLFAVNRDTFETVANQNPHTYGWGGDFSAERPQQITMVTVFYGGVDHNVALVGAEDYQAIRLKSLATALPRVAYCDDAYPLANLYLWPIPAAAMPITIISEKPLSRFPDVTTEVILPPGYEQMLVDGLAIKLGPLYGVSAPLEVVRSYSAAKRGIMARNTRVPTIQPDPALQTGIGGYNVYTDGPL